MLEVCINGQICEVLPEITVLTACKTVGLEIPQYCYHESLSISGNCRQCLIEMEEIDRIKEKFQPYSSCTMEFTEDDIVILTDSVRAMKARESVASLLLINHPLDCPICDQGGDCDLQDQSNVYGQNLTRFNQNRRSVLNQYTGQLIKTIMTRCIQCTRCVRFADELGIEKYYGTIERGSSMQISTYVPKLYLSEISGNVIDLCPVGALTSNSFKFKARAWEINICNTIDITDSTGSFIKVATKGDNILRISSKYNKNINGNIISNEARFSMFINKLKIQTLNTCVKKELSKKEIFSLFNMQKFFNSYSSFILVVSPLNSIFEFAKMINLSYQTKQSIKILSIDSSFFNTKNYYFHKINTKINNINNSDKCIIVLGFNPHIECAAFNVRLKKLILQSLTVIYGIKSFFEKSNYHGFLYYNLKNIFSIFEGKNYIFSSFLLNAVNPLFLVHENLQKTGIDFNIFLQKLSLYSLEISYLNISKNLNSNSLKMFNIKRLNSGVSQTTKFKKSLLFLDNITVEPSIINLLNDFSSIINLGFKKIIFTKNIQSYFIPNIKNYENNKLILNFENRPLFLKQIYLNAKNKFVFSNLLSLFSFNNLSSKKNQSWINFFIEYIKNPNIFEISETVYLNKLNHFNTNNFLLFYNK